MKLTVPEINLCERWEYVTDIILKEFDLNLNQIQKRSNADQTVFCKGLIALILNEEKAKAVYIASKLNIARTQVYATLKVAGSLLETHPVFKRKYLTIIEIITANED